MCPPRLAKPELYSCSINDPRRNDRIEHHLRTTGRDLLNRLTVVRVIEGKVLLSDDRATVGRDDLTDFLVHRVRPNVVS